MEEFPNTDDNLTNDTLTNDNLLRLLSDNNPVDEGDTATSPKALALVDSVLSDRQRFDAYAAAPAPADSSRRWGPMVAVAAAVALLVGAVAVLIPSGSTPAMAAVKEASADTSQVTSGRAVTDFRITGTERGTSDSAAGRVFVAFDGDDIQVTTDIDKMPKAAGPDALSMINQAEARMVDGTLYLSGPGAVGWMAAPAPEMVAEQFFAYLDGRTVLDLVADIGEVEEIGTEDLDGPTTHFRGVVDLAEADTANADWLPPAAAGEELEVDGVVTVDVWVGDDGLVRQASASGDLTSKDQPDQTATFSVTTELSDLGADVEIDKPEGDIQTFDFTELDG